MPVEGPLLEV